MTNVQIFFDVLRNGVLYTRLQPQDTPSVSMVSTAEIKMTLSGTFMMPNKSIHYLTDRIVPAVKVGNKSFTLGKYIITDAVEHDNGAVRLIDLNAYDLTYLVKRSKIETRLHFAAGTNYITAIRAQLVECGISDMLLTATTAVLTEDREDWEPGTDRLTIINELLAEINYRSLYADLSGNICAVPVSTVSAEHITKQYRSGQYSVLYPEQQTQIDYFNKPNVFIRIVDNADKEAPMTAIAENNDPQSPFSIGAVGQRIADVQKVNNIASQAALQTLVNNLKADSLLASNITTFSTLAAPHSVYEVVALDKAIYFETEWSIELASPLKMTHKGKEVMRID